MLAHHGWILIPPFFLNGTEDEKRQKINQGLPILPARSLMNMIIPPGETALVFRC
jgi:hypothetical protein